MAPKVIECPIVVCTAAAAAAIAVAVASVDIRP